MASTTPNGASERPVKTRFAPSPTGFLHIGGARTALFAWAFARHHGGQFVLRIEDSDQRRYSQDAVQGILDAMQWLDMSPDDGPYYQSQRFERYAEVVEQLLDTGLAYRCYCTPEELDALRESQRARGEKPRYDGRWRPELAEQAGMKIPDGVVPVIRFRNPDEGVVQWDDMVKGKISIANAELDDLVIARGDGSPTYNFCVVVDDWDREITHVIRGDDHVNNTPRQINILSALDAPIPTYGHVPMIHGSDGKKLSKRRDSVSVMEFAEQGYLPQAVVNYLARLGWSHGDDELFSRDELIQWFDGEHLSHSPSQFDTEKLNWVNAHYIKQCEDASLAQMVEPRIAQAITNKELTPDPAVSGKLDLPELVGLMKERAETLAALASDLSVFYAMPKVDTDANKKDLGKRAVPASADALAAFADKLSGIEWDAEAISATIKQTVADHSIKMPQFGVPLRVLVFGRSQTPAIEQVLRQMPVEVVEQRLRAGLPLLRDLISVS